MVVQSNVQIKEGPSIEEQCRRYRLNSILWIIVTVAIAVVAMYTFRKRKIALGLFLLIPALIGIYRIFYEGLSFGGRLAPWMEGALSTCTGKDNPILSKI